MTTEQKQEVALMRYATIAPLVSGLTEDYASQKAFYQDASKKGSVMPDGHVHPFAPATIEKWYLGYKRYGFNALLPNGRSDCGKSRVLDEELQEQIRYLKTTYPRMTAAAICRQLHDNGSATAGEVSESTVCRFVNQMQAEMHLTTNRDMRRYERAHINEVWCGDSSVGPKLTGEDGKKRRVYIIALIDDASRYVTAAEAFYQDNFVNLLSVIRSGVSRAGRPKIFNFDNGKTYRNKQMELLAARIGTTLNYCEPYTPTSKSKIERWFRTLKDRTFFPAGKEPAGPVLLGTGADPEAFSGRDRKGLPSGSGTQGIRRQCDRDRPCRIRGGLPVRKEKDHTSVLG